MTSVSFYFFAGDFADVLRRYDRREQQIYQTHNELARMVHDLLDANYRVNLYSFVTSTQREERPLDGLRVVSLGASNYSTPSLLKAAVESDDADAVVAHFPIGNCCGRFHGRSGEPLRSWRIVTTERV